MKDTFLSTKISAKEISHNIINEKLVFKRISHKDMALIWEFLSKEKGRTTDFSYGGLFMWVDLFKYEFAVYKDTLFIKGVVENDRNKPAFSVPMGSLSLKESIPILKEYCKNNNLTLEFSAVPEHALEELKEFNPLYVELLEDWSDYLYDAEMLSTLTGKKMSKKRNHVNTFINRYPDWKFEPLSKENIDRAIEFMDLYEAEIDDTFMAREESRLSREILKRIKEDDSVMKGGILYWSPGRVCAITIGDVKGDTLYVHIEKGTRLINGSYEMINREFARYMMGIYPEVKYINREDDAGDAGLKKAKESYHPLALLKKYNIIL